MSYHANIQNRKSGLNLAKAEKAARTLPYATDEEMVNNPFFDDLPQTHIAQLLQFVDSHSGCLDPFTHILQRYAKTPLDRHAVLARVVAYGTNIGLGKMG